LLLARLSHFPVVLADVKAKPSLRDGRACASAHARALTSAARDGWGGAPSRMVRGGEHGDSIMLRIHDVMLDVLRLIAPLVRAIGRRNKDLEEQLTRSATSVVLNIAEGSGHQGRARTNRYRIALGEARETLSNLRAAEALGYIGRLDAGVVARFDRVIGTLVVVTR
jgi:four helix bundle protein